ncbi:MAG: hypothetical protein ACJAXM_001337 [Arenicella sp.]|jgi:hypothetical protein
MINKADTINKAGTHLKERNKEDTHFKNVAKQALCPKL